MNVKEIVISKEDNSCKDFEGLTINTESNDLNLEGILIILDTNETKNSIAIFFKEYLKVKIKVIKSGFVFFDTNQNLLLEFKFKQIGGVNNLFGYITKMWPPVKQFCWNGRLVYDFEKNYTKVGNDYRPLSAVAISNGKCSGNWENIPKKISNRLFRKYI